MMYAVGNRKFKTLKAAIAYAEKEFVKKNKTFMVIMRLV
jgi:hypothetical protein